MSLIVKVGKKGKQFLKKYVLPPEVHHLSYTRRIERIQTNHRICAMTFDDGPMNLPAAPDRFQGKVLTDVLLDILAEFGAKGTFDVIGDTSENYPDKAGKLGSAAWGGIRYDHYPDIHQDAFGGVVHNDRMIRRMLDEGHQITNHGYRHIIFGKKSLVYGQRVYLGSIERAVEDLKKLDKLLYDQYNYKMTMGRPPHYVDKIRNGFTSYDVYDYMNYQYMAASFDGAGWLPSTNPDPAAALEAEINAMTAPIRTALEQNPDFFCGQIIFQKDGYNMAKRTPVAWGLREQLEILKKYGYEVVTVNELMKESPFKDVGREDEDFSKLCKLAEKRAIVYSDNSLKLDKIMTIGELAMLLAPKKETISRRWKRIQKTGKREIAYYGAMEWCAEQKLITESKAEAPVTSLPASHFEPVKGTLTRRAVYKAFCGF